MMSSPSSEDSSSATDGDSRRRIPELLTNITCTVEEGETFYKCPFFNCTRKFRHKRNLVSHFRADHQSAKRPHACTFPNCNKSFLRPAHLMIHSRIHTGEVINPSFLNWLAQKPYKCDICGKRWNQKSALKQHMRSHTGEKPFRCTVEGCTKRFSTSSSCKRHAMAHEKLLSGEQKMALTFIVNWTAPHLLIYL